jgi:diaminopropionate ammonia-lyase
LRIVTHAGPSDATHRLLANPRADRSRAYGPDQRAVLSRARFEQAEREIRGWPGYGPTPLRRLEGVARELGLSTVAYKDESARFGLGAFKALGGAYGVWRVLQRAEGSRREGASGREVATDSEVTVTCATAGNHGRAVAWGAELFGCGCVVHLPRSVSPARATAIAEHGAEIVRYDASYDETVALAHRRADEEGWIMVSDTSRPGYTEIPRDVMQGYTVLVEEALRQMSDDGPPTHAFVQAGVGGLAAAVCAHLWETLGADRPIFVVVEPHSAACFYESARAGRRLTLATPIETLMSGLACAEPSLLAWEILDVGADFYLTIPDGAVVDEIRRLASPTVCGGIVAGESGPAGLAALRSAAADPASRERLGLDGDARVLTIGTEGATDPDRWREIVGRDPSAAVAPGEGSAGEGDTAGTAG